MQEVVDSPYSTQPQDNYGTGGFLNEFEAEVAALVGKEAAVFMPSGTMAQQIALRIWADESGNPRVAFHPTCHLEIHEQMAYRELHHLESILVGEKDRLITIDDLKAIEEPVSTLLIELPQREIGGQLPSWQELGDICDYAKSRGWRLHLDGARLWECRPFFDRTYAEIAGPFDSVYVSFYKILNGMPGAILAGPKALIDKAKVWQRRHGGNLHRLTVNAITAKLGLDRHLHRIPSYVAKAADIAEILRSFDSVRVVPDHPPTNMMHVCFEGDAASLVERALQVMRDDKVFLFSSIGPDRKLELSVGDAALDLSNDELRRLFSKVLRG